MKKIKTLFTEQLNNKFAKIENLNTKSFSALELRIAKIEDDISSIKSLEKELVDTCNHVKELVQKTRNASEEKTISLWNLRNTEVYRNAYTNDTPLVTIRIASYNKTDLLVNKALKSALNQTYKNIEVIVVNDGPNPKTKLAIKTLNDKRVTYVELPYRSTYPNDDRSRWQVAGSPGMNYGAYLAKGQWIAPLDDDDEFTPDHIEKLLKNAISSKSEIVFGAFELTIIGDDKPLKKVITPTLPPEEGKCTLQAALYLAPLKDIFRYDRYSYLDNLPGDWSLVSSMLESGVRMSTIDDVVVKMEHISDLSTRR